MKVAVISSTVFAVPLPAYGGLEQIAYLVACGLANRGHAVTLMAPHGSTLPPNVQHHGTTKGESEQQAWTGYKDKLPGFDVVIDHSWEKWSYVSGLSVPILGVLHAPIHTMYASPPPVDRPRLVAISQDQAKRVEQHLKRPAEVAYNGIDVNVYTLSSRERNARYLFLARFSSIKGPDLAIEVAKRCKVGLDLVGDYSLTNEPELLASVERDCNRLPYLRFVGPQSRPQCVSWFQQNKALLHPNERFAEPFGLAPVEAMACGMPVLAWNNGAMAETVKQGETGFLVNSLDEMTELVRLNAVGSIKAERCREWASQFSVERMVERYEELCQNAITTPW